VSQDDPVDRLLAPPARLSDRRLDEASVLDAAGATPPDPSSLGDPLPGDAPVRRARLPGASATSLSARLFADPPLSGVAGATHTLVVGADGPVSSLRIDYGDFAPALRGPPRAQADGDPVRDAEAQTDGDGSLTIRFGRPRTADAIVVEYDVSRNPPTGERHPVEVVLDGRVATDADLPLLGG
jgi:hypothetical protein